MSNTTLRSELLEKLEEAGESWADVDASTLSDAQLDAEFSNSRDARFEWVDFTLWTKTRVYFPRDFDGLMVIESVLRNPPE